jgi:hypothetical protein
MSLAFLLFCLWLIPALASPAAPVVWRGASRLVLFGIGVAIAILALVSGGWLPGAFAILGVLSVIPELPRAALSWLRARIRARLAAA